MQLLSVYYLDISLEQVLPSAVDEKSSDIMGHEIEEMRELLHRTIDQLSKIETKVKKPIC